MKMQGKTYSIQLGLEILTPVQCGSGEELFNELDYVAKDKQVFVVDQVRSFNEVASGDHDLDDLLTGGSRLSDLVAMTAEHYGYTLPTLNGAYKVPDKIRAHLKDALFQPYIAGSALKGAIRTALLAEYLRLLPQADYKNLLPTERNRPPKERASQNLLYDLLGKEPKQDIFRALHVKDAIFKPDQLRLIDIRWLNLTGSSGLEKAHWRSMSTGRNLAAWKDADGIYAEMLKPKSEASFQLQWDGFLLSDLSQWQTGTGGLDLLPGNFDDLKIKLNRHASYRLQQEIAFYHRYGALAVERECQLLLNRIANDPDSIYMQLSWGSGWRGMSGDWMDETLAGQIRKLYNLGKNGMPFPKTRRLAVSGEPKLPLGWVRLFPYAQIEEKIKQQQTEQAVQNKINDIEHGRLASLTPLEIELEAFLNNIQKSEWDTRLLKELEQDRWSGEDRKQVAEKIKQLMIKADKWLPDFSGSNRAKLKNKERSLKVQRHLDG